MCLSISVLSFFLSNIVSKWSTLDFSALFSNFSRSNSTFSCWYLDDLVPLELALYADGDFTPFFSNKLFIASMILSNNKCSCPALLLAKLRASRFRECIAVSDAVTRTAELELALLRFFVICCCCCFYLYKTLYYFVTTNYYVFIYSSSFI